MSLFCVYLRSFAVKKTMPVLTCNDINLDNLETLLKRYALKIVQVGDNEDIPGSFWKPPEAGLIADTLYIRHDTPVHSALHEACHYICMDQNRRETLHTDAGGRTALEEDSTCYMQILLADYIPELKRDRMFKDMDEWGYSFRLGSAEAWFESDAEDAQNWLLSQKIITADNKPSWQLRI